MRPYHIVNEGENIYNLGGKSAISCQVRPAQVEEEDRNTEELTLISDNTDVMDAPNEPEKPEEDSPVQQF